MVAQTPFCYRARFSLPRRMAAAESLDDIVLGAITMEEDDIQTLNLRQCGQNLEVANLTDPIVFWLNVSNNNNSNFTYTEAPSFVLHLLLDSCRAYESGKAGKNKTSGCQFAENREPSRPLHKVIVWRSGSSTRADSCFRGVNLPWTTGGTRISRPGSSRCDLDLHRVACLVNLRCLLRMSRARHPLSVADVSRKTPDATPCHAVPPMPIFCTRLARHARCDTLPRPVTREVVPRASGAARRISQPSPPVRRGAHVHVLRRGGPTPDR